MKSGKVQRFRKGRKDSKNWNSKDARKIEKAWILNDRQLSIMIYEISWKSGIQKFKDSKKDRRNQTCKDAESFRLRGGFIEGLDNDIGELKKFEREGRGEKRWLKALKSVFMGGIFVSVGDFSPPRRFLRRYLYLLDIYERSVCTSATADFEITSQTFSFSNGVLVNPLLACRLFLAPVLPSPSQNNSQHDAESHATRIETPIIVFQAGIRT